MTRCAAALALVLAPESTARAEGPLGLDWTLDLSAQTSFPLSVGAEAQLGTPIGVTASFAGGYTPEFYMDAITAILRENGTVQTNVEPLVSEVTSFGAWNVRATLGFTLREGLEIGTGYTYLGSDAQISLAAIEAAYGFRIPYPGLYDVPVSVQLHAFHARLGWRFLIERHFVVRAAIGWTHVIDSDVTVNVPRFLDPPGGPADRKEIEIEQGLGRYGFTPEVLLSAGFRIG